MRVKRARATEYLLVAGLLANLLASVPGCGQVSPPDAGLAIDTAPGEIAETVCAKAYTCCTATELMGNDMAGTSEPDCETKTEDAFRSQLTAVKTSQQQGRSRYDGA